MTSLTGRTLLDRYFLRELVGSGGMADVYLAWDKLRSTRMAIKILRQDLSSNSRFFQQFAKEAEILNKLEHPNIVRLYEFDKDDSIAFIVMDWVDGSNLRQIIRDSKQVLSYGTISRILESISSALHFAHENKIYHCDIKPANIMVHVDGRVLLTDFGVAHLADEAVGGGTPPYMAPEQFTGGTVDARTDVYALGITLFEILSGGNPPYRGLSSSSEGSTTKERIAWEHINLPPPKLSLYNPQIPSSIERVISSAMRKEPEQRFQTVLALRDAFDNARSPINEPGSSSVQELVGNLSSLASAAAEAAAGAVNRILPKAGFTEFTQRYSIPPSQNDPVRVPLKSTRVDTTIQKQNTPYKGKGPVLYCRSGQFAGQTLAIQLGETILGRGSQSQIKLTESAVSRRHATIIHTKRGVYIRDDGSNAGTYVNGNRITGPVLLHDRDVVQIGYQQVFEFNNK